MHLADVISPCQCRIPEAWSSTKYSILPTRERVSVLRDIKNTWHCDANSLHSYDIPLTAGFSSVRTKGIAR